LTVPFCIACLLSRHKKDAPRFLRATPQAGFRMSAQFLVAKRTVERPKSIVPDIATRNSRVSKLLSRLKKSVRAEIGDPDLWQRNNNAR